MAEWNKYEDDLEPSVTTCTNNSRSDESEHLRPNLWSLAVILVATGSVFGALAGLASLEPIDFEPACLGAIAYWPVAVFAGLLGAYLGWRCARLRGLLLGALTFVILSVIAVTFAVSGQFGFTRLVQWLAGGRSTFLHAAWGAVVGAAVGMFLFLVIWVYDTKLLKIMDRYRETF
jgi:hypothetical protein